VAIENISKVSERRAVSLQELSWLLLIVDQLKKRLLFHTSYKLYLASLSFAVFHLFIMCIAYGKYANDGRRDEGFRTFGNCIVSRRNFNKLLHYLIIIESLALILKF